MKHLQSFGWIPDRPDHRDFLYSAIAPKVKLPTKVDLRAQDSPIENQGHLGQLHGHNALAGHLQFLEKSQRSNVSRFKPSFLFTIMSSTSEGTVRLDSAVL